MNEALIVVGAGVLTTVALALSVWVLGWLERRAERREVERSPSVDGPHAGGEPRHMRGRNHRDHRGGPGS